MILDMLDRTLWVGISGFWKKENTLKETLTGSRESKEEPLEFFGFEKSSMKNDLKVDNFEGEARERRFNRDY